MCKYLSTKLYEFLLSAKDAKIVLLTGTPVINYPNEFGILFNILRGYIKTWEFPISDTTAQAFNKDTLMDMLKGEKSLDYIDYEQNLKVLTITRNPFGFKNKMVWHDDVELPKSDLVVLPGGFSYGDYLRCGAIAARSPIMNAVIDFAKKGGFVLGVCNGFQVLTESGLLPGALMRNSNLKFVCKNIKLKK